MSAERWLPVVGFEGRYEVSDLGRLRSLLGKSPKIMQTGPGLGGYPQANLRKDGRTFHVNVHVVLLTAFVGPCPSGMESCHGDDIPGNCTLANLRWDTRSANNADARRNGRYVGREYARGEAQGSATLNTDDVRCIKAEPHFPGVLRMLAKAFGITKDHVWKIRREDLWGHVR